MGILCEPLCAEKGIHSLACETLHAGKEAVFSAHWEATRLVFKASRCFFVFLHIALATECTVEVSCKRSIAQMLSFVITAL